MSIVPSDRVRDREDRWGVLVVDEVLDARADEVEIEDGRTVADDNPGYPVDDTVIAAQWAGEGMRYHFPASRLIPPENIREVAPADLWPSPLHARQFEGDDNEKYIEQVRRWGHVGSFLVARETDDGELELLEGHKRKRIAAEAGINTVEVIVEDIGARDAARRYLADHLDGLDARERERTLRFTAEHGVGVDNALGGGRYD